MDVFISGKPGKRQPAFAEEKAGAEVLPDTETGSTPDSAANTDDHASRVPPAGECEPIVPGAQSALVGPEGAVNTVTSLLKRATDHVLFSTSKIVRPVTTEAIMTAERTANPNTDTPTTDSITMIEVSTPVIPHSPRTPLNSIRHPQLLRPQLNATRCPSKAPSGHLHTAACCADLHNHRRSASSLNREMRTA